VAAIDLIHVSKRFADGHAAVADVSLAIDDGELMVLVGPSGSGKSTLLRLVAGLETPSGGHVRIGGCDVTAVEPQARDVAMVFQSYALYPHKTVRENLAFGLRMRGADRTTIARRVDEVAALLGMAELLDRKPAQLSGGQRQRVALGRAIARQPHVFLFDEPLSNLDPRLRAEMRTELALLHRRLRATMVYVTHDQEEAMTLGERIAVLRDGRLEQVGPPLDVYARPANVFVAGFIGSPAMNIFPASRDGRGGVGVVVSPGRPVGEAALLGGIRPHDVRVAGPGQGDIDGVVEVVEALGSHVLIHARVADAMPDDRGHQGRVRVALPPEAAPPLAARIGLGFPAQHLHWFEAASGRRVD
jgi:ABC-type sugar transport system ATPase subunit